MCTGYPGIGGRHLEIRSSPRRTCMHQLGARDFKNHRGKVASWFKSFLSTKRTPTPSRYGCWRVRDAQKQCEGRREDIKDLVLSLPILLVIELGNESSLTGGYKDEIPIWDIAPTLTVLTKSAAEKDGLIHDLVGLALIGHSGTHFIARHASRDHSVIYTYDGMKNGGFCMEEPNAKFATHVSGNKIQLPTGFKVWAAFYHLRGGSNAQDKFFETQKHSLGKRKRLRKVSLNLCILSHFKNIA
jgi:hypothetical protein